MPKKRGQLRDHFQPRHASIMLPTAPIGWYSNSRSPISIQSISVRNEGFLPACLTCVLQRSAILFSAGTRSTIWKAPFVPGTYRRAPWQLPKGPVDEWNNVRMVSQGIKPDRPGLSVTPRRSRHPFLSVGPMG